MPTSRYRPPVPLPIVIALAATMLAAGCANPGMTDAERAARAERGQTALEGMENAALQDNNPNTPVRAKPPN